MSSNVSGGSWHETAISVLADHGAIEEQAPGIVIDLRTGDEITIEALSDESTVPFVDVVGAYESSRDQLLEAITGVMERGDFILGPAVAAFEESFARFCGVSHAVGVDSGYSALELILRGMGIGPGDEVITAANTFIATVNAIHFAGATPVLVDVDPNSYNLDPEQVASAVTDRTAAIISVHLYGRPADMVALRRVAHRHGLALIEDACQAHGAMLHGSRAGALGDAAAFSFYPSKNLGAFGDGGMIVTNDHRLAERCRMLRNVGSLEKYHHEIRGFNRRLDTLHAVVLERRLQSLDAENSARRTNASLYNALMADLPIKLPEDPGQRPEPDHVYHLYVIESESRDALVRHLGGHNIATGIHYPIPVHLQPAYAGLGHAEGAFPVTEAASKTILSLPMYPHLRLPALARVASSIRAFFNR